MEKITGVGEQLVGPERRELQIWCVEGCVNSRRPVNSDVGWHPTVVKGMAAAGALTRPEFCDGELVN